MPGEAGRKGRRSMGWPSMCPICIVCSTFGMMRDSICVLCSTLAEVCPPEIREMAGAMALSSGLHEPLRGGMCCTERR